MTEMPKQDERDAFGNWFAGIVAGEGSFTTRKRTARGDEISPRLKIRVRDDDRRMLDEIHRNLRIGTIRPEPLSPTQIALRPGSHPAVGWRVESLAGCVQVVRLLERYPLRTKKEDAFLVWAEIVREKCKLHPNSWRLTELRDQLKSANSYVSETDAEALRSAWVADKRQMAWSLESEGVGDD